MTIEEIRQSDEAFLKPADIASLLECNPQYIREQARKDPTLLGFPVVVIGSRTRIPRKPFLQFLGEGC